MSTDLGLTYPEGFKDGLRAAYRHIEAEHHRLLQINAQPAMALQNQGHAVAKTQLAELLTAHGIDIAAEDKADETNDGWEEDEPTVARLSYRAICMAPVGEASVCGDPTYTEVEGEPLCKRHRDRVLNPTKEAN